MSLSNFDLPAEKTGTLPGFSSSAILRSFWRVLASLELAMACLAFLMILVAVCTVAQADLGVYRAVETYIRSFVVFGSIGGRRVPVSPGGASVGLLLLANLATAQISRLELSWRRAGLWLVHLGLLLLIGGEFVSGMTRVESAVPLHAGETLNYGEIRRDGEPDGVEPGRRYFPFSVTLEKFDHEVYPGTDIPKSFASLVKIHDPAKSEDVTALITMNHPLRYRGMTFYQASFGENGNLSVLQAVQNPGWVLPYLSCVLVGLGMVLHFAMRLSASKSS